MLAEHKVKEMPPAPRLRDLLGPSFILLGLGLGSGELVLWPHLASSYGMGIIWAAILGVTLQFFMNMEIERYTLVRGESIFVGFARLSKFLPIWFIFSTLIPWMWPGIITSSAVLLGGLFGITNTSLLAIILLLLVGTILTLGPVLYKTQETFQKVILLFGTPFVLILTFFIAKWTDWQALALGIVGKGDGFWFLPAGISVATFLAAIAYSGAGGNLNLAQSFYIKEKGFGMGKYSGRITSLLTGKAEEMEITGTRFTAEPAQLKRFRQWWRLINFEHGIIFWLMGTLTIVALAFLAFSSAFGQGGTNNISFLFKEAIVLGERTFPIVGKLFLAIAGIMLFSTQLGVMDTTSRILTENLTLTSGKLFPVKTIRRNFYIFLWLQIFLSIAVIAAGFTQPLTLLILAAVLNAGAMFVHIGLTLWLNITRLEKELRPSIFRVSVMIFAFLFFGYFAFRTIISY
jgi:hypothetical protein